MAWSLQVQSYGFVLALLYLLVSLVCAFQLWRILFHRHAVLHYQFGFLLYTLLWSILRTVFWLLLPWSSLWELVLQGSALLLQFSTFTFLVLFYAQMLYKAQSKWAHHRRRSMWLYAGVNGAFLVAFLATIVAAVCYGSDMPLLQRAHALFIAGMYLILSASLAIYGWRLLYLVSVQHIRIPFLRSKVQISALTVTLVFVFATRAVKDCLAAVDIAVWDLNDPSDEAVTVQALLFSTYLFWEIVPAAMVLLFFWHIPAPATPIAPPVTPYFDTAISINTTPSSVRETPFFDNPRRYDSDDELATPSSLSSSAPRHAEPRRHAPPRFAQYAGYNTRSPLLERNVGSPWNDST